MCPSEWSPDQGGLRVSRLRGGRRAVGYALSPRPTFALASRGRHRLGRPCRVKAPARSLARSLKPHTTCTECESPLATRPRSISPGGNRVQVAPRRNTHNSRHRHHRQFLVRATSRRIDRLPRPSISTTNKRGRRGGHFERACAVHSKQTMRNCPYFAYQRRPRIARPLNPRLPANNKQRTFCHSPISRENPRNSTTVHGNTNTIYMYTGLE